tara:strand:+ start:2430 stop:2825 length:396 start_codon:yes stop_codon:yes gene_type:complete
MGANVFFPDYVDRYDYYDSCYGDEREPTINQTCIDEQKSLQEVYEEEQRQYNGNKYVFIVLVSLVVLIAAFYISLESSVIVGLFLGSTLTTFFSTWIYFDTQSKLGFAVIAVTFFMTIFFISKKKKVFLMK